MEQAFANVLRQALTRIAEQKGIRTPMRHGYAYAYKHALFTIDLNCGEVRVTQDGLTVFCAGIGNIYFVEGKWCDYAMAIDHILTAKAHRERVSAAQEVA